MQLPFFSVSVRKLALMSWVKFRLYLSVLPALVLQKFANRAIHAVDPAHQINGRFSRLNWIAIAVGGLMVLLVVASLALLKRP